MGKAELGHRIQRDSSAAKLAPNVGPEASKGPMEGGIKDKNRTYDQGFKRFGLRKNFVKFQKALTLNSNC